MTEVYFNCSDADHFLLDRSGVAVSNYFEAYAEADRLVRQLMTAPNSEDWRGWELRATDEHGEELFVIPFASAIGRLH